MFGAIGIHYDMPNPAYTLDNRGKRSVVLDLRTDGDCQRMDELLADAQVFVTNLKPDVLDRFGLDPDSTMQRHPHLVYCSVSGYGLDGPERVRASYDLGAFWAREPRDITQTPLMNCYQTSDDRWLFLTCLEADRHLRNVLVALGREDLFTDDRFASGRSLRKHSRDVIAVLDAEIGVRTLDEWAKRFDAAGVWWAPVHSPADVLADEQVRQNGNRFQRFGVSDWVRTTRGPTRRSGRTPRPPPARRS